MQNKINESQQMKSGIYRIRSIIRPFKVYVGSTYNLSKRFKDHSNDLSRGVHRNSKIQNHHAKYGTEDLIFEPILICDREDLIDIEQLILDEYREMDQFDIFNINIKCTSRLGVKASEKTRRLISVKAKNRIVSDETRRKLSIAGKGRLGPNKGRIFNEETRLKMSRARLGKKKKGSPLTNERKEQIRNWHLNMPDDKKAVFLKKLAEATRKKRKKVNRTHQCMQVIQYDLSGNEIAKFKSIKDASINTEINPSSISACVRGGQKTAGKFIFKYANQ